MYLSLGDSIYTPQPSTPAQAAVRALVGMAGRVAFELVTLLLLRVPLVFTFQAFDEEYGERSHQLAARDNSIYAIHDTAVCRSCARTLSPF